MSLPSAQQAGLLEYPNKNAVHSCICALKHAFRSGEVLNASFFCCLKQETFCYRMSKTRIQAYRCFIGPLHTNWGKDNTVDKEVPYYFPGRKHTVSVAGWYPRCSNIRTTWRIAGSFGLLHHPILHHFKLCSSEARWKLSSYNLYALITSPLR